MHDVEDENKNEIMVKEGRGKKIKVFVSSKWMIGQSSGKKKKSKCRKQHLRKRLLISLFQENQLLRNISFP